MITRGWPERNANIKPPIDVIISVSLTPIHFSVFSPSNTRNTRTIQEVLCTISNWSIRLLKCFQVYEEPLAKTRKFIVNYNVTMYLQWYIAGILMHHFVLKRSPHEIHIFDISYDYWHWWKVLSKKMKVTLYISTILITPSHLEAPV